MLMVVADLMILGGRLGWKMYPGNKKGHGVVDFLDMD